MAKRASFDDKLAAIRRLRDQTGPEPGDVPALRKALGDRSNFVVAAAAEVAGAWRLAEVAADLEAAFARFLIDPIKDDKLCRAKLAVVQALEKLEHPRAEVFEKAAAHVQMEPAWGPPVDTAPPLRAAGLIGLTRIDTPGLGAALVDALLDPARDVRSAAASCLGAIGSDAAALVLRFKCRIGDDEPEVLSEALRALLAIAPDDHMPFVREFLDARDENRCEAAALAMGNARFPQALGPLLDRFQTANSQTVRETLLLAVAMLRASAAIDALLDLVADDSEATARAAMDALKIHKHDPKLVERLADVVARAGSPTLQARFAQDFPPPARPDLIL
ncbi:HEAT repeat domain-containing protein [Planctomyces sp. SH-PL62]|uniref:HEAT repeat domain-containing protein n=1 Tax=Planctomyces sp. SH-PL62 TaxID=1636152 RepID=UPI00078B5D1A|nr:HEAT repeat domain-containing protein [Planctomyces sp. SH-PL62]AMV38008.1 HEAT repeat protein [Planctomyces sp. SH-PL62]